MFCVKEEIGRRVVVKVGTNVITNQKGYLNKTALSHLVNDIEFLREIGIEVVLVSSGATGSGKSVIHDWSKINDKTLARQILASVGQVHLINTYAELFSQKQITPSQILVTKSDFRDRKHYQNMQNCFLGLLKFGILPIVNENDGISVIDVAFTDNDELAGLVAAMINADTVIILTSVDGLLDGHPDDPNSHLISEVKVGQDIWQHISETKSSGGRGGMQTKCKTALKNSKLGIRTYFLNGKKPGIIRTLVEEGNPGTHFLAKSRVSSKQRWIASDLGFEKGTLFVDKGASQAIQKNDKIVSLLPIGITRVTGNFEKGDQVKICTEEGETIAFGSTQISSQNLSKIIGKTQQKPVIRYEDLVLV